MVSEEATMRRHWRDVQKKENYSNSALFCARLQHTCLLSCVRAVDVELVVRHVVRVEPVGTVGGEEDLVAVGFAGAVHLVRVVQVHPGVGAA